MGGGHEDAAHGVWPDAAEEAGRAFVADHLDKAVDGVFVVSALLSGECGVALHAHVEHVGGVACYAAEQAGEGGEGDEGGYGGRRGVGG